MCDELIFDDPKGGALSGRFMFAKARRPLLAVARKAFPSNLEFRNLR